MRALGAVAVVATYVAITVLNEHLLVKALFLRAVNPEIVREHFWIRQSVHHLRQMGIALLVMIFAIAHIEFSFSPLGLEYNPVQVAVAFVLGVFYGRSLPAPSPFVLYALKEAVEKQNAKLM